MLFLNYQTLPLADVQCEKPQDLSLPSPPFLDSACTGN